MLHNKLPQIQQLKTAPIFLIRSSVGERSWKAWLGSLPGSQKTEIKAFAVAVILSEACGLVRVHVVMSDFSSLWLWTEVPHFCWLLAAGHPQHLEAAYILSHVAPPHLENQHRESPPYQIPLTLQIPFARKSPDPFKSLLD